MRNKPTIILSRLFAVLALGLVAGACNGNDLTTIGGLGDGDGGSDRPFIDPTNPHNGEENGGVPQTVPTEFDTDGDGIPNEDDNIPCMAFYIKVYNQQVSSASVIINGQTIVEESFFPTEEVIIEFINPVPGVNTFELGGKLTGSPEDVLHVEIWDMLGVIYLHETIVREGGSPEPWSASFEINVTC